ncbi:TlpA family protein disulfide reductase [Hyphomonas sp. WL0036]|uniref:TlpA family protein disulfide reductase n=1 Tax=Hyphomonas sediminis TaxID=2866160 RepID=UPI001C81C105|nr:TlpA disulfide reductase family protein [Hyphomonas sediminis]MBY9068477.1 TlpA family protein disulfide reductase [Hyphomonas sediminis]
MKYAALAAAFILSACAPAAAPPAPEETASAPTVTDVADGPKAQGFITENTAPPPGAQDNEDGTYRDADGRPFQYALLGQHLPEFTAPTSDGGTFSSADIKHWTVIDVWGAWCGDCVADGPYVEALSRAIAQDPDLEFVSLHTPANANRTTPEELFGKYGSLEKYFEAAGYSIPSVVLDNDASVRNALQIRWTPSYLLVSPDGVVRGFRTDLSVVEDQPIKTFIQDIAEVRKEVRDLLSSDISDIQ